MVKEREESKFKGGVVQAILSREKGCHLPIIFASHINLKSRKKSKMFQRSDCSFERGNLMSCWDYYKTINVKIGPQGEGNHKISNSKH